MEIEIGSQQYCKACNTPLDYEDQECRLCYLEDRAEGLVADNERLQDELEELRAALTFIHRKAVLGEMDRTTLVHFIANKLASKEMT